MPPPDRRPNTGPTAVANVRMSAKERLTFVSSYYPRVVRHWNFVRPENLEGDLLRTFLPLHGGRLESLDLVLWALVSSASYLIRGRGREARLSGERGLLRHNPHRRGVVRHETRTKIALGAEDRILNRGKRRSIRGLPSRSEDPHQDHLALRHGGQDRRSAPRGQRNALRHH